MTKLMMSNTVATCLGLVIRTPVTGTGMGLMGHNSPAPR